MPASSERMEHPGPARNVEASKTWGMLSRRRVITILAAVAGLPLLPSGDQPKNATRLHRWQGTALGNDADASRYSVGLRKEVEATRRPRRDSIASGHDYN